MNNNFGIPFEIKKPHYNETTLKAMDDDKKQKNVSKTFNNVDEMFEELDKLWRHKSIIIE